MRIFPDGAWESPRGDDCNIPDFKYIMTFLLFTGPRAQLSKMAPRYTMLEIAMTEIGEEPSR
jgi:hypothetical protein